VHEQVPDDWFVDFQVGLKAKFWRAASEPWADAEAAAIERLLGLPAGARVLDAPCGAGRIAVRLAERGLDVTGIDISAEEVEEARRRGSPARFEVGDLRALPQEAFDAALCWGNSFGYMPPDQTVEHLAATRRALRPGGRLVLDSATVAESWLPRFRPELEHEAGGITMRGRNNYDAARSRVVGEFTFEDGDGRVDRGRVIHHVHTVGEVVRLLEGAGFGVDELLGDPVERTPYALGSPRLVAIATALQDLGRP
jgi:SAM-dependent methyltransferase